MTGRQFATVLVITFIAGLVWLVSDIIFNTKPSIPISDKEQVLLEPINPTFSKRVLDLIDTVPDKKAPPQVVPQVEIKASPEPAGTSSASPILSL